MCCPPPPPPIWQRLCSQFDQLWAISNFLPRPEALGNSPDGKGCIANLPSCGPLLMFSATV